MSLEVYKYPLFTFKEVIGEQCLHYHTGQVAIEIVNTIEKSRSKIVRNRVIDCHLSPDCRPTGDKWQSKTL